MAVVEARGVKLTNNPTKGSRIIKAPEVEDEDATEEEEDSHMDVETPRTSNASTATSLDTMPRIVGTKTMNKPMLQKQQMILVMILSYFSLMMIQVHNMRHSISILAQAITCVGRKICS